MTSHHGKGALRLATVALLAAILGACAEESSPNEDLEDGRRPYS